jgi:hypothetical protein
MCLNESVGTYMLVEQETQVRVEFVKRSELTQ